MIKNNCTICDCLLHEGEGISYGLIGILPVQFCPTCYSGLVHMIKGDNDND